SRFSTGMFTSSDKSVMRPRAVLSLLSASGLRADHALAGGIESDDGRSDGTSVLARPVSIARHHRSISLLDALPLKSLRAASSRLEAGSALAAATSEASGTNRPGAVSISLA